MIPQFSIDTECANKVLITGLTQEVDGYVPDDAEEEYECMFKYGETVTMNIIERAQEGEVKCIGMVGNDHSDYLDEVTITLPGDGFYRITHLLLPSVEWLKDRLDREIPLDFYEAIYVSDGLLIYKYIDAQLEKVEPEEVLERNTYKTTISRACKDTMFIMGLQQCYVDICKEVFNSALSKCQPRESDLIYKRDFVWMTINVIKYYVDMNQFFEAQRILEEVKGCNGFCGGSSKVIRRTGCGCGKA